MDLLVLVTHLGLLLKIHGLMTCIPPAEESQSRSFKLSDILKTPENPLQALKDTVETVESFNNFGTSGQKLLGHFLESEGKIILGIDSDLVSKIEDGNIKEKFKRSDNKPEKEMTTLTHTLAESHCSCNELMQKQLDFLVNEMKTKTLIPVPLTSTECPTSSCNSIKRNTVQVFAEFLTLQIEGFSKEEQDRLIWELMFSTHKTLQVIKQARRS